MKKTYLIILFFSLLSLNSNACSYSITMYDSSWDGWDGASYWIYTDGVTDSIAHTFISGNTDTQSIEFNVNEDIDIVFKSGTYDDECSWIIYDFNGDTVCIGEGEAYNDGDTICSWNEPVCPTCSDGIQNGIEEDIDCGGFCNICPTISCEGNFFDTGGPGMSYSNYENTEWLFCSEDGQDLYMTFFEFDLENGNDYLFVYNGTSDTDSLIGVFTGDSLNGQTIISFNASNCLYFVFTSDGSVNNEGWKATYACGEEPDTLLPIIPTEEDCEGAIEICQDFYYNTSGSYGTGMFGNEIGVNSSECIVQELGGNWYRFTPESTGILNFTITPDAVDGEDYDWVLFDLSNAACIDLSIEPYTYMVSANSAGNDGSSPPVNWDPTGISSASAFSDTINCAGPGSGNFNTFNPDVVVNQGGQYMLYIAQFDGSNGYTLDLSESEVTFACNTQTIKENVEQFNRIIYPNPASDYFWINTKGNIGKEIKIFDISGKQLAVKSITEEKSKMDISNLDKGIYLVRIAAQTNRLIVE